MRKYLFGGLVAVTLFIAPASAQAQEKCYGAGSGPHQVVACVDVDAGLDGTTVAPRFGVRCTSTGALLCFEQQIIRMPIQIGKTGFVPNPDIPPPCVDPQGPTIRSQGALVGWLYVDGAQHELRVPPFFVGNEDGCL